ncbi:MAG: phosphotransferase, partial [Solimonas sp.]
ALCATLLQAWIRPADPGPFLSGDRKAIELAAFIEATWRELGQPCPEHVIEVALAYAADRRKAFDPDRAVLAHGDAHPGNLLVAGSQGKRRTFKFVDPEGLFVEPAYDLSAVMREWGAELLAGDPLELGLRRCHLVARRTELAPEPIWQWGFIERVSTGLHLRQLGWDELSREYLAVAEAWAAPQGHAPHRSASRGWPDRSSG